MVIMGLVQGKMVGRRSRSDAEKMLRAESELSGVYDFAARLPRLSYNYLTGGGIYRVRNLRIFPGNWDGGGDVPEHGGLIFMGHHLTFDAIAAERAIITRSTFYKDAPVSNPNKKYLAKLLEDPSQCGDPAFWKDRDISKFANGELVKAEAITIRVPTVGGGSITGPVRPFLDSYVYHVLKPLTLALWRG